MMEIFMLTKIPAILTFPSANLVLCVSQMLSEKTFFSKEFIENNCDFRVLSTAESLLITASAQQLLSYVFKLYMVSFITVSLFQIEINLSCLD